MIARPVSPILLIVFALVVASCGRPELSRQGAAKLIETNSKFGEYKSNLLLQENAESLGVALEWWHMQGGAVINLSSTIRSEGSDVKRAMFGFGNAFMVLNKPAEISVTVTGITGDKNQTSRAVDFDWQYKDLQPLSRRIAVQGGTGQAMFELFDDGWRMVELLSMTVSKSPYPLSEQEKQDIAKEIASVRDRLAAAAKVALESLNAAKAEKSILYKAPFRLSAGGFEPPRQVDIVISESYLYFPQRYEYQGRYIRIWFGNIKDITEEEEQWGGVDVSFACPNTNKPHARFIAPQEKEIRTQFIANFRSIFEKWKMQHAKFYGSQECREIPPIEFVR